MADVLIPITRDSDDASFFDLQVVLEDVTYTLEFRWNERATRIDGDGNEAAGAWFMNVFDAEGVTPLALSVRLVVDYPLAVVPVDREPPGIFFAIDTEGVIGEGVDPDFDDLGTRVQLHYATSDDL